MKKVLSIVTVCIMLLSLLPTALAEKPAESKTSEAVLSRSEYASAIQETFGYFSKGGNYRLNFRYPGKVFSRGKNLYDSNISKGEQKSLEDFMMGLYDVLDAEYISADETLEEMKSRLTEETKHAPAERSASISITCDRDHTIDFQMVNDSFYFTGPFSFYGKVKDSQKVLDYLEKNIPQSLIKEEATEPTYPITKIDGIDLEHYTKDGEPVRLIERLTFTTTVTKDYTGEEFATVATPGTKMHGTLEQISLKQYSSTVYYWVLTLSGDLGEKQYYLRREESGFGFTKVTNQHGLSGGILTFFSNEVYDPEKHAFVEKNYSGQRTILVNGKATADGEITKVNLLGLDIYNNPRTILPSEEVSYEMITDDYTGIKNKIIPNLFGANIDLKQEATPTKEPQEKPTEKPRNVKQFVNPSILRLTAQGYSEEEAYYAFAVFCLAHPEDSRIAKIIVRYRNCGDWDEVFSFYNVDRDAIEEFIKTQKDALKRSEIPDEIYKEMVDFGMTDKECEQFAREVYILHAYYDDIDLSIAWEAQKKGKTPTDLLNERQAIMQARWQLVEAVVMRKSTVKECITEMKKENPDMTMGEIIAFVNKELKDWKTFLIAASNLTEEELTQAEEAGITNFFDVYYLKQACRNHGFSYTELLEEIKNGTDVDTVVERRVTPELIEETKRKLGADDSILEMLE